MPLPIAHALLGASIVAATRENITFRKDWPALLVGAMLAVAPDFDLLFPWVFHFDHRAHGGPTHSFLFALLLGAIGAGLLREKRRKEYFVFSLASFSHGVLDLVTKREFGGAAIFWPFSNQKFKLGLIDYFPFYPAPGVDPWGPLLERALEICNYEMMIFMPIFIVTVWARRWRDHVNADVKPLETVKSMAG
jgi:membrane-bound metal-dependent hydrolase YbcI (DUF457 family)